MIERPLRSWMRRHVAPAALLLAVAAGPAGAVTIEFATSTDSASEIFFAGTTHEIAARFLGTGGTAPVGVTLFGGVFDDDFDVTAGGPAVTVRVVNGAAAASSAGFVHPGIGPRETRRMDFDLSIVTPGVASGPSTVTMEVDVEVVMLNNGQFQRNWSLVAPTLHSFDLGALGILDAQFLTPPSIQALPDPGAGQGFSAAFTLRSAPPPPLPTPEPGVALLFGLGILGLMLAPGHRSRRTR